jgi:hypothetical protein
VNGESAQLELLAALLAADRGWLRFRDRLRIERCLFRIAARASRRMGHRLKGLNLTTNARSLPVRGPQSLVKLVLRASRLKSRMAALASTDAYIDHAFDGATVHRTSIAALRLAIALRSFASTARRQGISR